ncbi:MAG: DUF4091 domain-containing protein [Anaerolineae bacterium]
MNLHYTLTHTAYKYRADAPEPLAWGIQHRSLAALANETVACQLVMQAPEGALATLGRTELFHWCPAPRLRVAVGDLTGPEGQPVEACVEASFVGLVPAGEDGALIADPLLADESIALEPGRPQALWLSLRLPAEAPPGRYILPISLYLAGHLQDEAFVGNVEVGVDLASLALPEPRAFRHHLDLWQHACGLARGHGVRFWSEAHWRLIALYADELARLGQKAITLVCSDGPWAGQRCRHNPEYPSNLFEYNIVGLSRGGDGHLCCDFSRLDRYVETYLARGIDEELEILGLLAAWDNDFGAPLADYPDNIRLSCYDQAAGTMVWLRTRAELAEYLRALQAHLVERGWWERVRFAADEPADVDLFRQRLAFIQEVCPGARAKVPCNHIEVLGELGGAVSDWVPILPGLAADVEATWRAAAATRAQGGRFGWYVCCWPPRPNNFITSPALEGRVQGWLTAREGLDGFLRWAYTCWPADPWGRPRYRDSSWPPGDMFLVYPGRDGRPVRSLRNEMLLAGIQDGELVRLAQERAATDPAVQQALEKALARVLRADLGAFADVERPAAELYSVDAEDYEAARRLLIAALTT